jgi:Cu-Zn family superoxide dismutase
MKKQLLLVAVSMLFAVVANADIKIPMHLMEASGATKSIGYIDATQTEHGVLFTPHLEGLSPGQHGFHIHENPSCDQAGMAAGGHLDPQHTQHHLGPNGKGHLGDLPFLTVNEQGIANVALLAPHLTLAEIQNRSLIIHEGGDNYSDTPKPLGGGGARIACGIIK